MAHRSSTNLAIGTWTLLSCLLCFVFGHEGDHGGHHHDAIMAEKLKTLRDKWDVEDVIRDPDHIKEDLKSLLDLSRNQTISPDETYFYFIRMNDFDNSDSLDGIEIHHAMQHVFEHYEVAINDTSGEQILTQVDLMLQDDLNADGFLTYGEYRQAAVRRDARREAEHKAQQEQVQAQAQAQQQ